MEFAINKNTNEIVSAFDIFKNGSYQNLTKGEWISLSDPELISNLEECSEEDLHVHYVKHKEYTNWNNTPIWCSPHFAIYPNSKAKTVEESKEHKMLKEWLFNRLKSDDLELRFSKGVKQYKYDNKIKLSELNINWNDYSIEVTTKGTKRLRADILLPFKNKDSFLGRGIIFEIQLSNQSENQTYERTIERALHGYSVVWLFEKDFIIQNETIELNEKIVKVNSFSQEIHFAKKNFIGKLKRVVEEQCRFLDEKIKETNYNLEKLDIKKEEIYSELMNRLKTRETILYNKIENLENNPFKELVENYKKQLNQNYLILNSKFESKMKELNYPFCIGECKKCYHGYMTKKYGKFGYFYGCSNYPLCKHIINIKSEEDVQD
jgi:hypothetical protein